ncbi:polysaccharide biosynthesis tyrosine autokinase [Bordetella genomosp. 13]|uniref:Capsular biosynthesis protein n=1 Tax=Bordetella genomosp. 13 TaxID=463040 RepID=A0A1W6ZIA7_9BORD|nr:polysaccharide biosynthesis tyrosine autokinase [Bordetella genomosp. 13]ARP97148.1 hypothetical protein CAL15_23900 [Bordetella genomosp. 13]
MTQHQLPNVLRRLNGEDDAAQPVTAASSGTVEPTGGGGKLGERLVSAGLLTAEQVQSVIELQKRSGVRFGEAAIQLGYVTERDMQIALSEQFNYATALISHPTVGASLAIAHDPFGREAEAIRQLRAEISLRLDGQSNFSISIVSANDGDGKSYVAASLAIAYSQSGQRVLFIDADLRGSGNDLFQLQEGPGLSTMLAGRDAHAAGMPVPGFPLLHVLSAGPRPPNPTEMLGAPAMRRFIGQFQDSFDVIVVDTPAANRSADAQLIASQTDVCLVVVRQDATLVEDFRQVQERMRRAGAQLIGSVYNGHDAERSPGKAQPRWRKWLGRR